MGKTALLDRTFPDFNYVSLDDAQNAEAAESRPGEFLSNHQTPLILDEIQYAPALLRHLKVYVDKRRDQRGLFLLTGSQSFPLMQAVSESLAGRAEVVPMLSLSATEWAECNELKSRFSFPELLWRGGYPGLWSDPDALPSRDRWYQGYMATYLERDVRNMLNVSSLRDFERFLRACAIRNGQLLNMSEMGRDVGISPSAARQWLGVLHASGQVALLEPYHRNLGKRLVKTPKLYFTDTGLASWLCGFQSAQALAGSAQAGAFWENHVICQWLRWRDWHLPSTGLWFWRDRVNNEVDLVIERDAKLHPVECKRTERPNLSDLKGIRAFKEFYGESATGSAWIACQTNSTFDVAAGVTAISGWKTWSLE